MAESRAARIARTVRLIERLKRAYPDAHCELDFGNPLELLIATILSARCTDKQVNLVTAGLFKKYQRAADYASAPRTDLEQDLKRLGMFRTKARNIQSCCAILEQKYSGQVPSSMEELIQLDGVGRKTANVVLGNAFGQNHGVVVDTHVSRLSGRLQLSAEKDPVKIEIDLQRLVPQNQWTIFSHWLIWHGRRRCGARNPDCSGCELKDLCPTAGKE